MNIKKIILFFMIGIMCTSVVFPEVLESKDKSINGDLKKKKSYFVYIIEVESDKYTLNGYTEKEYDDGLGGLTQDPNNGDRIFNDADLASLAYAAEVLTVTGIKEYIKNGIDNPLEYPDNSKILINKGFKISTKGNAKILSKINNDKKILYELNKKKDISPQDALNIARVEERIKVNSELVKGLNERELVSTLSELSQEDRDIVADRIAEKTCKGSIVGYVPGCEFIFGDSAEKLLNDNFVDGVGDIETYRNDDGLLGKDELKAYNYNLIKKLREYDKGGILDTKKCNNIDNCKGVLDDYVSNNVNCDQICLNKINSAKQKLNKAKQYNGIKTNWIYTGINLIKNPDAMSQASLKFFSFGADYSKLPNWLREEGFAASQICIGEIDGYLDDESSTGGTLIKEEGSLTQYSYDFDGGNANLDVKYDLRAKRTQITPDGKTSITLSIYLKAPNNEDTEYIVGIGYKTGSEYLQKILINKSLVAKGEIIGDVHNYDVVIEDRENTYESSFFVYLKAKTESGIIVANDKANIFLVKSGTENRIKSSSNSNSNEVLGNGLGNQQDSTNSDLEQPVDTFWNGFN